MQHSPENVPSAGVTDRGDSRRGFGGAWPLAALALILLMLLRACLPSTPGTAATKAASLAGPPATADAGAPPVHGGRRTAS